MYYFKRFKTLVLMLLLSVTVQAQIESGKVYNFVNVAVSGKSLALSSGDYISIATTDKTDYTQLWYAEANGNGFTLRNLGNGRYLYSPNATSNRWTLVKESAITTENSVFSATAVNNNYAVRVTSNAGNYNYMHADASNNIVCWESSSTATQWTIKEVSVSSVDLENNWNILTSIDPDMATVSGYQTALDNLFNDKACTTLKKSFASEDDVKADADYKALPEALQQMVLKVYAKNWEENNFDGNKGSWSNDYALKYRVQLYEPYNEPEAAAKALGINAHTNLNNPTGIFTNTHQSLYVMVEGDVKDGASLYLASYTGHGKLGGYAEGVELHEGLNVIPSFVDDVNYCVNYVVHTFDTSDDKRGIKAKARKLSDYDDLKIHIEGGYINGYYNKVGDELYTPDKAADWDYIEARATQTDVTVLGKYVTLQFPLRDEDTNGSKGLGSYFNEAVSIEASIDEWDNIMLWERLLLGVLDEATTQAEAKQSPYSDKDYVIEYTGDDAVGYGDYYNVHGLSFGTPPGNPYGSWDHCGYPYGGMQSYMVDILTNAGAHWTAAHEIGHQHQGVINMRGETEVTNNLFSNVVLWYFGESTSRVNGTEGSLTNVLANLNGGGHYLTNNIWAMTQMYYKLFLYYHVLGHNPQFYPTLFEMMRQDSMEGRGGTVDGAKAQLHLYKKVCMAAGEDLTEFFRAYGFFVPLDGFSIDDYSVSTYTMTQTQINNAISEVKAWAEETGAEENIAVLFINDATGETVKSHKGDVLELYGETTVCAELGGYASFNNTPVAEYIYSVTGNTVTMKGTGGVGFAIYNMNGELVAFSDKKSFTVSDEVAKAIASGEVRFAVINSDNTVNVPVDVMDANDAEAKYEVLGELLYAVNAVLNLTDAEGVKVGYYKESALIALKSAYNTAKQVYDNKEVASYVTEYGLLSQAYEDVMNDKYARVGIVEGYAYRLVNNAYPTLSMSINDSKTIVCETEEEKDAQLWYFEASSTDGSYYVKNKNTNTYAKSISRGAALNGSATSTADAASYQLLDMGDGTWALVNGQSMHCSESQSNQVVGWDVTSASQWYITTVAIDSDSEALYNLQALIEQTESLIDEIGSIKNVSIPLTLTEDNYYSNAECKDTRSGDQFTSYSVLCDKNVATFFHSDYSSEAPNEDHYIRIDVGSGNELKMFNVNYTTRESGNLCAPTKVVIEASNDASSWVTLRDITSGLPTTENTAYTIENLGDGVAYRYIRMRVYENSTKQKANDHYYFIVSEFGLSKLTYNAVLNDDYASSITAETLLSTFNAVLDAKEKLAAATTAAEYEAAYTSLKTAYETLLNARNAVDEATFKAKKQELEALIATAEKLLEKYPVDFVAGIKNAIESAEATQKIATTVAQVEKAINKLQAQCDALDAAMNFKLSVSEYGFAGLYLPYAAKIPAEATAYIAPVATASAVELQAVEGDVLPANTAVIVEADQGEYTFSYTDETAATVTDNLLKGSATTVYKEAAEGTSYYILGVKDELVALYWARVDYADENGTKAAEGEGTHFKVGANKIYFEWNQANGAPMFRITRGETGTTSIDNAQLTIDNEVVIYDLTGRRVEKMEKGIYIVNGQKVVK